MTIFYMSAKGRLEVSNLTAKQISFCENYILTRDIKQSSLNAGYSQSYSKSKAYELLQDEKIKKKIQHLETEHNQNHFKRLSIVANEQLESILTGADTDSTRLRAIELVYKLSGVIKDEKVSLNINNQNQVLNIDDFYDKELTEDEAKQKALDLGVPLSALIGEYKGATKEVLQEFEKEY